jgi:hypothetical protein
MRSFIILAVMVGAIIVTSGCTRQGESCPGGDHDAGPIFAEMNPSIRYVFPVRNTTGRPVKITAVRPTCSCTTSKLGKYQLAPGEKTTLEVAASVPNSYSNGELFCALVTDHPRFREWGYILRFQSVPRVAISPFHADLGSFSPADLTEDGYLKHKTEPAELFLDVFNPGQAPRADDMRVVSSEGIRAVLKPRGEARPIGNSLWHRGYSISASLAGRVDPTAGSQGRTLMVRSSAGGQASATLTWQIRRTITAAPASVHFGALGPDDKWSSRRLLLNSAENTYFKILSVDAEGGTIRVVKPDTSVSSRSHLLELELTAAEARGEGAVSGTIRITTDEKRQALVRVPWTALVDRQVVAGSSVLPH